MLYLAIFVHSDEFFEVYSSHLPNYQKTRARNWKPSLSLIVTFCSLDLMSLDEKRISINMKLNICQLCRLIYWICFCKTWNNVVVPFKFIFNIWIYCFLSSLEGIDCQQPIRRDFLKQIPWCLTKSIINLIFNLFCFANLDYE